MDRLDDLTVLIEVVDSGSLSLAGERLGLSPSAVSRRLSQMEARLGARLVTRTTRRIALTEAGAAFCARARAILAALDEAERALTETTETPAGTLRVTMPVVFGQMHVAPLLPAYLRRYPRVTVEAGLSNRPVRLVEEGLDLAIRSGRLADSSLVARRLTPLRHQVVGSPGYFERCGAPATVADLARHNCLAFVNDASRQDWAFAAEGGEGRRETVRVTGTLQCDSLVPLHQAALAGIGLARLPGFLVADDVRQGRLVPVLEDRAPTDEAIYAVFPTARHLLPKVRSFIDHLLATLGDPEYQRRHGFA